jgi:hypothetical protein
MEIDGESLKVENIKSLTVRKSNKFVDGRIKVMIKQREEQL